MRMVRALLATPRCTAWRIHHVAYVENLNPLRQSNFLGGADEAEDSLLDEVAERDALRLVALGDRHDEAQVAVDHPLLGEQVALLDALRELDLLRRGEQRVAAGLVEAHLERIGGVEARADAQVELGLLLLGLGRDLVRRELVRERLGLGLVEVVGEDGVGDVGRGEGPVLIAQVDERVERFGGGRGQGDLSQRTPSSYSSSRVTGARFWTLPCASAVTC